jgi:sulfatase maturation enzyme AslB (radical SAM superfamily)
MKEEIKLFLKNVKNMRSNKQRVNVMYLTTACNLDCDYCYEGACREELGKQKGLSKDYAYAFLNEIMERERGCISTLVIMGGEPLLVKNKLIDILEYANNLDHQFAISLVTNGTLLNKFSLPALLEIWKLVTTVEISYDGSGHDRRVYKTNKLTYSSKGDVERCMDMLGGFGLPFKVSYTLHKDNYKNVLYDIVRVCELYIPEAIKISIAYQELSDMGVDYKKWKKDFKPYGEFLFGKYGIPICDFSCGPCQLCDPSNFVGNSYMSPTTGQTFEDAETKKEFDAF